MNTDVLRVRTKERVMVMTINDPSTRNSIGPEFFHAAREALAEASVDPTVGAIVIVGAGGFFSSGGNLHRLAANREHDPAVRREGIDLLNDVILHIRQSPQPVITAVEGGAAGAGMALALAGDLLVAARDSFFAASYIKAGLTPDGGLTALLAESMPRQAITQLCLTGERIGAERMHGFGVVAAVAEPGRAEADAIDLGRRLAEGPARATGRILDLCRTAHTHGLAEQMEREAVAMVVSQGDVEAAEGICAVLERRRANFGSLPRDAAASADTNR